MMRNAEDLFQELLSLDESHRIEAKRHPEDDAHQLIDNSHQPTNNGHQPDDNSHQSAMDTRRLLATVPLALRTRIPPVGSKPRREVLRVLIEDPCRWQKLSARELATILNGREPKPLVRDYLSPNGQ